MKKLLGSATILVPMILLLSGCPDASLSPKGVMVSGTISFSSINAFTPASLIVQQGTQQYAVSVAVPAEDQSFNQVGSYSILNVPPGTYTFIGTFTSPVGNIGGSYSVNGGALLSLAASRVQDADGKDWDWTVSVGGLIIQTDETINVVIRNIS